MSKPIDFRNPPPEGTLFRHKGRIHKLEGVSVTHSFNQRGCDLINSGEITEDEAWSRADCVTITYEISAPYWDSEDTQWYRGNPDSYHDHFARFHDDERQPRCVTGVKSLPVHTPTEEIQ